MYEYIIETETPLSELETFPNCKETWAFGKATEYCLQGTTFVSFSSVTLKLKTHSQLTQSACTGTDCLFWINKL